MVCSDPGAPSNLVDAQGYFADHAASHAAALRRSAWAGSQRYGTAVWSGDIGTDFAALRAQIAAGLSIGLSGIPWWTTDIGGFHGGDPDDPDDREVVVRWFQFGAFCPVFRLHGFREPRTALGGAMTGGPNEVWSYGPRAEAVMTGYLRLRERLRPYLSEQMRVAAREGCRRCARCSWSSPATRGWRVAGQFMLGPDLLVAPVTVAGARV